jgi:hypothetical protein
MDYTLYITNAIIWILVFVLVGVTLQKKIGALGFTFAMGGSLAVLFSILQDTYYLGPTILTIFPFNVYTSTFTLFNPILISVLLYVTAFLVSFVIEREIYKQTIPKY